MKISFFFLEKGIQELCQSIAGPEEDWDQLSPAT